MHWASFDFIGQIWRDAQCMVQRGMEIWNRYGVLENLAGPLICGLAMQESFPDATTEHQDAARLSKMPVHPVVFGLCHDLRLLDLFFNRLIWLALDHHVTAELTG